MVWDKIRQEKIRKVVFHDDVIKWKHFPRNWPFVREIHRSPVNFPHKGQWRGALMFSLNYAWINDWVNNREAGDLRRQHGHYDVIVMYSKNRIPWHRNAFFTLPDYWSFVKGIHQSPVVPLTRGQLCRAVEQTTKLSIISVAMTFIWCHRIDDITLFFCNLLLKQVWKHTSLPLFSVCWRQRPEVGHCKS